MPRLTLCCDVSHSVYTLRIEGTDWQRDFTDLDEAMDFAPTLVEEETPLLVFNEHGKEIIRSSVGSLETLE